MGTHFCHLSGKGSWYRLGNRSGFSKNDPNGITPTREGHSTSLSCVCSSVKQWASNRRTNTGNFSVWPLGLCMIWGQQDDSAGKSTSHRGLTSWFNTQNPWKARREPSPQSCPQISTHVLWYMHAHTHAHMHAHTLNNK